MNNESTDNLSSVFRPLSSDTGFTLIELVIVIVILGILGVMGSEFISKAFKGFADSDARIEIYEEGKMALVRMEREIRNALPNAIRVSDASGPNDSDTISFGVIDEKAMNDSGVFGLYKETDPTGTNRITDWSNPPTGLPVGTLVSIYNTKWDDFDTSPSRIYAVQSVDPVTREMTLDGNIVESSPNQRYYAVSNEAIRYSVSANGTLNRATANVDTNGVDEDSFGNDRVLAKNITQTGTLPIFVYSAGTLTRNSLVAINFSITKRGTSVNFHKEIHIRNVP